MPRMGWHEDLTSGLAASALFHAAAFGALVMWMPAPPRSPASAAVTVALVVEPARGVASEIAAPATATSPDAVPAISREAPGTPDPPLPFFTASAAASASSRPAVIRKPERNPPPRHPYPKTVRAETIVPPANFPPPLPTTAATASPTKVAAVAVANAADKQEPPGSTIVGPSTSAPSTSSPWADYLAVVMAWLERHKEYPDEARSRQEEGTVLIAFAIDHGGRILSSAIRQSSGDFVLDAAAKELLRRSNPLPPPPATYPDSQLDMVLPVTFAFR